MSSPRQDLMWRMMRLLEDSGFELRQSFISWIYKTGFPKAYDVSKGIDRRLGVLNKRKVVGHYNIPSDSDAGNRGKEYSDMPIEGYVYQDPHRDTRRAEITKPVSVEAKEWDGWKSQTGLKPAQEPVLMVYKPRSEPTIVDNVLRWGVGAINVDATRIPINREVEREYDKEGTSGVTGSNKGLFPMGENQPRQDNWLEKGRFPANLLVSDGALDTGEITKNPNSYIRQSKSENINAYGKGIGELEGKLSINYGDVGDQSRYFDLDAWAKHHGLLDVPKPDTAERDYGLRGVKREPKSKFNKSDGKTERFDGATSVPRRNTHPTVKPIKLMAYLIELGCPRNGVVLDPFVGSGTTRIAAKQLGRKYIGIEIKPEYHVMAEARVAAYPQPLEWFQESQDVR